MEIAIEAGTTLQIDEEETKMALQGVQRFSYVPPRIL
jgi:hypothetical protein